MNVRQDERLASLRLVDLNDQSQTISSDVLSLASLRLVDLNDDADYWCMVENGSSLPEASGSK